jgi:hypothetical protein
MTPTTVLYTHLLGIVFIIGFGYLWYKTSDSIASRWALAAACIVNLSLTEPIDPTAHILFYTVMTVITGTAWYFARHKRFSGWLLFLAILNAIVALS